MSCNDTFEEIVGDESWPELTLIQLCDDMKSVKIRPKPKRGNADSDDRLLVELTSAKTKY